MEASDPVDRSLTLNDLVVLAVLSERPAHGFAVARDLAPTSDLGRIVTLRRSQVYRSIDRLAARALIEATVTEPGDGGPSRQIYQIAAPGRRRLEAWLATPVAHVRDLRVEFLTKLRVLERQRADPTALVEAQQAMLEATLAGLGAGRHGDVVDRWRAHNAEAVARFLAGWPAETGE